MELNTCALLALPKCVMAANIVSTVKFNKSVMAFVEVCIDKTSDVSMGMKLQASEVDLSSVMSLT